MNTGFTRRQSAERELEAMAKRRQAKTGEDYFVAYDAIMRSPESKPHRAALASATADMTATELAKSASEGIADLRELLKLGVGSYWQFIREACEARSPGKWQDALPSVAADFPRIMSKARQER
jgi:hypothetical protein